MPGRKVLLGQYDWGGGMEEHEPANNQALSLKNCIIRNGKPETRPGIRRKWRSTGIGTGFSFPFTFPFTFIGNPWGNVQGAEQIRFSTDTQDSIIFVNAGTVYQQKGTDLQQIDSAASLGTDEVITFTQAEDKVYMHRGEDLAPQVWDGTATGFTAVPAPVGDPMPNASRSIYHQAGRMWLFRDQDDVYASDILDVEEWDDTNQIFSILPGNGDEITNVLKFRDDKILVTKKNSISALLNINVSVTALAGANLNDYVSRVTVDDDVGCLAPGAIVQVGEDVWFYGYNGIFSLRRNNENNIMRDPVAVSEPIQSLIERVNLNAANKIRAVTYQNYVIFAVPLDNSTINNTLLVYDLLAPAGSSIGAWVGYWQSKGKILSVVEFFKFEDELLYINELGIIEKLFVWGNTTDSDEPYEDSPEYDASEQYQIGDLAGYADKIYECTATSTGNPPTDTDYWEEQTDIYHVYDIESEIITRYYRFDEFRIAGKTQRSEFLFEGKNPKVSFFVSSENVNDEHVLASEITYSQTAWTINNKSDWNPLTDPDDEFDDPHREDYAAVIDENGIKIPSTGWAVSPWQMHNKRYLHRIANDRSFGYRITNTLGAFKLVSVGTPASRKEWAKREVI